MNKNINTGRINIAEILKGAPKGRKIEGLWSIFYGHCEIVAVEDGPYPIHCKTIDQNPTSFSVSKRGFTHFEVEESVLFPSNK